MAEHDDIDKAMIIDWARALESYARDWDGIFENRPNYFTQEFWYLLVGCLIAHWQGKPLTVGAACQAMKTGSNRTREERIQRAVRDGYLVKERAADDHRSAVVRPSPQLEEMLRAHLVRTLTDVRKRLAPK